VIILGNYENIVGWSELGSGYMDECDELMDFSKKITIFANLSDTFSSIFGMTTLCHSQKQLRGYYYSNLNIRR